MKKNGFLLLSRYENSRKRPKASGHYPLPTAISDPVVFKDFLAAVSFETPGRYFDAELGAMLDESFIWSSSQQGQGYWGELHEGTRPLSSEDLVIFTSWLDQLP